MILQGKVKNGVVVLQNGAALPEGTIQRGGRRCAPSWTVLSHLFGITETRFVHILSTFPLVPDPVKLAAQNAYRDVERGVIR